MQEAEAAKKIMDLVSTGLGVDDEKRQTHCSVKPDVTLDNE